MSDVNWRLEPWDEQAGYDGIYGGFQVMCGQSEICTIDGRDFWQDMADFSFRPPKEMVDAARLIAAAPDLLEACHDALGVIEATGRTDIYDKLFAAIAKAKGEGVSQ